MGGAGRLAKGISRYLNGNRYENFSPHLPGSLLTPLMWSVRARSLALHALPLIGVLWVLSAAFGRRFGAGAFVDERTGVAARRGAGVAFGVWFAVLASNIVVSHSQSQNFFGARSWHPSAWWQGTLSDVGAVKTLPLWAFGAVGMCLMCHALWHARRMREREEASGEAKISWWKRVARGDELGLSRFDVAPLVALVLRCSAWLAGAALLAWPFVVVFQADDESVGGALDFARNVGAGVFVGIALGCLLAQIIAWRRSKRAGMLVDWAATLRVSTTSAALLLTLIYVGLLALEMPLQARFERGWSAYLKQGELQMARGVAQF
jgi:hypothetical protein